MANSKYEYTRLYEQSDRLPLGNWIVVRIDGRGFHRFSEKHNFQKPNDIRAIKLMNKAAEGVLRDVQDIVLCYGHSDEYSFIFHHTSMLYSRRSSKLISTVASTFTAHYIAQWPAFFPDSPLVQPTESSSPDADPSEPAFIPVGPLPTFDGRAICYPRLREIRDYLSWRQVDCHINNLYNTTFWALVQQGGLTNRDAEQALAGTYAKDKHEILWSRFGVNYNNEMEVFRKGSAVFRDFSGGGDQSKREGDEMSKTQMEKEEKRRRKAKIVVVHEDLIGEVFWEQRPWLLVE